MTKIKIVLIGNLPVDFDKRKIENWSSSVFRIVDAIESYSLSTNSDGPNWEFTDEALLRELPSHFDGDFLVAIVDVPLELNWYSRRISSNKVVFTFHEIKDVLIPHHIPLENVIYRLLYAYTLIYLRYGNNIPEAREETNFAHDEARGCLFDMNGIKNTIYRSCDQPVICSECVERLKQERISDETIRTVQRENRRIQKPLFYRFADFIKKHPIWSLIVSALSAILLGAVGSLIATLFYELVLK